MGRPLGSKNKKPRKKARSAYATYKSWYKKYTKGEKEGWFSPMLSKKEFEQEYELAKRAGIKANRARMIAQSQEFVDRKFEKRYKELYGKSMPDIKKKEAREQMFFDFVDEMQMQGLTYDDAREEFEKYFY